VSWQLASFLILGSVLIAGFAWYERSRPPSQVVALVAALAALAIAGRIAFAAFPNVKPTTDIVILAGYALGPAPGFAVGALTALVSNLWFGQGPWTPWQMAGWGLCGVFGAALTLLPVRRIDRFSLAAACGLAGLAYGALLNFSLMATYGGDLSVQRFTALESRAIPFDLAHAVGNVVFALIAGPAMLRMLVRFRERFEWRARTPAVVGTVLAALLIAGALPGQAKGATGVARAAGWLASVQNSDGGWGSSADSGSSPSITGWVMLGLESAGRNPLDVSRGGKTPVDYLRSTVGEIESSGDYARTILALEGAGVDTHSFAGRNLVSALAKRRGTNGSWEGWPGTTAYAVLALRAAGDTGDLDKSLSWLAKVQNSDGGWGDEAGKPSTPDNTGAVMQAMRSSKVSQQGLDFLRGAQLSSGGFALGSSGPANAQSTAWAAQGMIAIGTDPSSISRGGNSALVYLLARQASDGHFEYSSSSDQTPVWVTGQVLPAVAGKSFPLSPPPREPKPKPAPSAPEETSSGPVIPPSTLTPSSPAVPSPGGGGIGTGSESTPGGSPPLTPPAATPGPPIPVTPGTEGVEPETPAAPPFEAKNAPPAPSPAAPLAVGIGAGGLALGSVLFLGRRFGW
jgi:Squalene-hopene cyclase C-terminal domain/Prenyltransferase and squalene oxidase repeat